MPRTASLAAALILAATLPAVAQSQQTQRVLRDACLSDVRALCSNVQPGGGRLVLCLDANRAKLSPACAKALPSSEVIHSRLGG
jgi:hypothetical protein